MARGSGFTALHSSYSLLSPCQIEFVTGTKKGTTTNATATTTTTTSTAVAGRRQFVLQPDQGLLACWGGRHNRPGQLHLQCPSGLPARVTSLPLLFPHPAANLQRKRVAHLTLTPLAFSADAQKRKSKWDSAIPVTTIAQPTILTTTATLPAVVTVTTSASGSKTTVISAVGTIVKKAKQ